MPEKSFEMRNEWIRVRRQTPLGDYAFGSVDSDPRWWWTIGRFGLCDSCGADVTGARIAYESGSRLVCCEWCAEDSGVASECRESRRARRARQQRLIRDWDRTMGGG
jgi:hypothetical protein